MPDSYKGKHQRRVIDQDPIPPAVKRQNMRMAERRVCQISIFDGYSYHGIGTGFLIGPKSVLTAYHVLDDVFDGIRNPEDIFCVFDILGPAFVHLQKPHRLNAKAWPPKDFSKKERGTEGLLRTPSDDEFDFVIIELETDACEDVIEDAGSEVYRGFVNLKERQAAVPNQTANILSFPGKTQVILESTGPFLKTKIDRRIQYLANANPGSSGGLVLNGHGLPVGYHSAGVEIAGEKMNQGIEFGSIIKFLKDYLGFDERVIPDPTPTPTPTPVISKAVLAYIICLFTLVVSTPLSVFASSRYDADPMLLLSAVLISAVTFLAGFTAVRFLGMTFLTLAQSFIGWAALIPLISLNGYAWYRFVKPAANFTLTLTRNDAPIKERPVHLYKGDEEPDPEDKPADETNHKGEAKVSVLDNVDYEFQVLLEQEKCTEIATVVLVNKKLAINYEDDDCTITQSTSTEQISANRIESIDSALRNHVSSSALGDTSTVAPLGLPGAELLIDHEGFILGYNADLRGANWIAHTIDTQKAISIKRANASFSYDSKIAQDLQNGNEAYIGNDYDRGSLIRRTDEARGSQAEAKLRSEKTYLYSINVPMHKNVNRRAYLKVEDMSTKLSKDLGEFYAYSGAIYPDVGEGQAPYTVLGPRQAVVPTHIYRVIYRETANGQWRVLAFLVPNEEAANGTAEDYIVPLLEIEEMTNLSFLPKLPMDQSAAKEAIDLAAFKSNNIQTGSSVKATETLALPRPDSVPLEDDLESSVYYQNLDPSIQQKLQNVTRRTGKIIRRRYQAEFGTYVGSGVLIAPNLVMTADYLLDDTLGGTPRVDIMQDLSINFGDFTENLSIREIREFPGRSDGQNIAILEIDPIRGYDGFRIDISSRSSTADDKMAVIGFPAFSPRAPEVITEKVFNSVFNSKRVLFGEVLGSGENGEMMHNALTLAGVSGAPIIDLTTGNVVAIHMGGVFNGLKKENFATILSPELLNYVENQAN